MEILIAVIATLLFGAFLQTSAGFGLSIVTVAVLPIFMTVSDAVLFSTVGSFVATVFVIVKYIKSIDVKMLIFPVLGSFVGLTVGINILFLIDDKLMTKILGFMLIILSVYFFFFSNKIKIKPNKKNAALAGFISGLLSGTVNMPGPPIVLYYSAAIQDKKAFISTTQAFFFVNLFYKAISFYFTIGIEESSLSYIPYIAVATIIGSILGIFVYNRMNEQLIKKVVYIVIALSGVWYLFS